jgi:hypothetical protein
MKPPEHWLLEAWKKVPGKERNTIKPLVFAQRAYRLWREYWDERVFKWVGRIYAGRGKEWLVFQVTPVWERMQGTAIESWGAPGEGEAWNPPHTQLAPPDQEMLAYEVAWALVTLAVLRMQKRYPCASITQAKEFLDTHQMVQLYLFPELEK